MTISYLTYAFTPCQFASCADGRPNPAENACRVCGEPVCDEHLSDDICPSPACIERAALEREEAEEAAASDALCAQLAASIEQAKRGRVAQP